jgi:hypothetical protein
MSVNITRIIVKITCIRFFDDFTLILDGLQFTHIGYRNHTRECHNHTHTCQNQTLRVEITLVRVEINCECRNHICACENQTACGNYTLPVEITLCL